MPSPALAGILQALGAGFGGYAQDQKARQERDRAKLLDTQSAQRLGLEQQRFGMDQQAHQASMDDVRAKLADRQAATARGTAGEQTINDNWSAAIGGDRMAQAKIVAYRPDLANEFNKPAQTAEAMVPTMQGGKPIYTPRSKAAGMEAPSPGQGADKTLVQVQQPDGSIVYTPRADAVGAQAPQKAAVGAAALKKAIASNQTQSSVIDDALKELDAHTEAVGLKRGLGEIPFMGNVADTFNQRQDPGGVAARAQLANVGSLVIHDRSGAAVTVSEFPRLAPFVPKVTDTPEAIRIKLNKLREALHTETGLIQSQLGERPSSAASPAGPPGNIDLGGAAAGGDPEAAWAARNPAKPGESFEQYHARYLASKGGI